jgi:hypothetical protein
MPARSDVAIPRRANVTDIRAELMNEYGYTYDSANDVLRYTAQNKADSGRDSEWKTPDAEGFITVRYHGLSRFTLEDHREFPRKRVAIRPLPEYNRGSKGLPARKPGITNTRRDTHMPPARGRRSTAAAAAPPAEPEANGEVDFQKYLDKDLSPTMVDYVEWFEENVAALEDVPVDKLLSLGSALYPHFQKSDFNIDRREARKAAREPEPEPAPAAKPARGRPRRAAAAAPEPDPEPEPTPIRKGRGRAKAASAEAPY